ncbi:MAG: GerMN domain-containing protein [Spirochaetia bacterium]|nr:GerMN domain-containing protein [Spirochaetia bacterium]
MGKQPARKTRSTGKKRRRKKSKFHLGASFWILLILLLGIIFYLGHEKLEKVISESKYFSKLKQEDKPLVVEDIESPGSKSGSSSGKSTAKKEVPKDDGKNTIIKMGNQVVSDDKDKPAPKKQEPPKQIQSTFRDSALYFVFFSPNGDIKLSKINRKVQVTGSPLQAVMDVLLEGATPDELNQGYLSLIPPGTKLKSIRVSDGIATMDFSEEFMFNTFGPEGMKNQLKQIIYTASEFPTVKAVQFLIDGKKVDYISEGVKTKEPLTKNSF